MVSLCLLIFFILLRLHFLHLNCRLLLFCLISKLCLFCCLEISINNSALYSTFFCPAPDLQAPFVLLSYMFYQCCRLLLPCLIHKLRLFCHVLHVLSTLAVGSFCTAPDSQAPVVSLSILHLFFYSVYFVHVPLAPQARA